MVGDDEDGTRDLIFYLRILWRHKWIIVLTTALAIAGALTYDSSRTRIYRGTATVLFVSQNYSAPGDVAPLQPSDVLTDIELFQGQGVYANAAKHLGQSIPHPTVTELGTTNTASVSVDSPNAAFAAKAANAFVAAYIKVTQYEFVSAHQGLETQLQQQINALQAQVNGLQSQISAATGATTLATLSAQLGTLEGNLQSLRTQLTQVQVDVAQTPTGGQLVTAATVDRTPVSPKPVTDAILAAVLGLLLGLSLALLLEQLDDRIRSKETLEHVTGGLPTLGLIPKVDEWRDEHSSFLVSAQRPRSPSAEAYRGLRTSIQFLGFDTPVRTLQITSPVAAEGKTTTVANLAVAMAQAGQRVVLVSCDLRRPRIHEFFGLRNTVGFTSIIVGDATLESALLPVPGYDSLQLLPSGPIPPNPSEILGGAQAKQIFSALSETVDMVIIDSPPVMPVTDASVLAADVDAVLLVVAAGSTKKRDVRHALETLGRVDAKVVGVVLNQASEADSYGYYRYGYHPKDDKNAPPAVGPNDVAQNGNGSDRARAPSGRGRHRSS